MNTVEPWRGVYDMCNVIWIARLILSIYDVIFEMVYCQQVIVSLGVFHFVFKDKKRLFR